MRRLVRWYDRLGVLKLFIGAIATAIPFYGGALLSYYITEVAALKQPVVLGVHAAVFVFFIACLVFVLRYAQFVREQLREEEKNRASAITRAYTFMDEMTVKRLAALQDKDALGAHFIEVYVTSVSCIQHIVQSAYQTFEASFAHPERQDKRVEFEVTFMTKSYRDGGITIPCWANRDARRPRSLIERENNAHVFENTVTAEVYREAERDHNPHMHIVADTSKDEHYHEVYPEQKKRIKSTIVYPVLSDRYELLGTLVVHCDEAEFFKITDQKYWSEVLEVFAKNIALAKARMDRLYALTKAGQANITVPLTFMGF